MLVCASLARRPALVSLTSCLHPKSGISLRLYPLSPRRRWSSSTGSKASDPLRILFCGSDSFSCASLEALHRERAANPSLVRSIDVVVRPDKPTGRGLKTVQDGPLKSLALELGLPVHERDTFTGWQPPTPEGEPINLIIAVSFGLFVPRRLLRGTKYAGLNVHPSLLPDLRGASPIQHAVLLGRTHTGVTLQTLDERAFDGGAVLARTPPPGVPVPPRCTAAELQRLLAPAGAALLVRGLREGVHVPPLRPLPSSNSAGIRYDDAPKIRKADLEVPWQHRPAPAALDRRARALGPLWTTALLARGGKGGATTARRVILGDVEAVDWSRVGAGAPALRRFLHSPTENATPGGEAKRPRAVVFQQHDDATGEVISFTLPFAAANDGGSIVIPLQMSPAAGERDECLLRIGRIKVEGDKSKPAARAVEAFAVDVAPNKYSWDLIVSTDAEDAPE